MENKCFIFICINKSSIFRSFAQGAKPAGTASVQTGSFDPDISEDPGPKRRRGRVLSESETCSPVLCSWINPHSLQKLCKFRLIDNSSPSHFKVCSIVSSEMEKGDRSRGWVFTEISWNKGLGEEVSWSLLRFWVDQFFTFFNPKLYLLGLLTLHSCHLWKKKNRTEISGLKMTTRLSSVNFK